MYRLALIGFGNVGQGFAQILHEKGADLAQDHGPEFQIVAVSDLLKGTVYNPDGLNPGELLDAVHEHDSLKGLAGVQNWDALKTIQASGADIVIELSYTDLKTGEPARTHLATALEQGKHVVTTNKGPIALHYAELAQIAQAHGVEIGAGRSAQCDNDHQKVNVEFKAT